MSAQHLTELRLRRSSQGKQRNDLIVVSGVQINVSVTQVHDLGNISNVSGSFLDADNIVHILYETGQCLRLDRTSGTAGNIVKDRRDLDLIADCCVMGNKTICVALL